MTALDIKSGDKSVSEVRDALAVTVWRGVKGHRHEIMARINRCCLFAAAERVLAKPVKGQRARTAVFACNAGFTMIEMLIVMSIIGILAAISVPNYQTGVIKAKEAVLREDLYGMRSAIDQFFADSGRYPNSLGEMVEQRYLREIPLDPFTRSRESWVIVAPPPPPPVISPTGATTTIGGLPPPKGNVYDVHSGSKMVSLSNTPYNEW